MIVCRFKTFERVKRLFFGAFFLSHAQSKCAWARHVTKCSYPSEKWWKSGTNNNSNCWDSALFRETQVRDIRTTVGLFMAIRILKIYVDIVGFWLNYPAKTHIWLILQPYSVKSRILFRTLVTSSPRYTVGKKEVNQTNISFQNPISREENVRWTELKHKTLSIVFHRSVSAENGSKNKPIRKLNDGEFLNTRR